MTISPTDLAKMIDHTLLKPEATQADLEKLCKEAVEFEFYSCCVNSSNIPYVKTLLENSNVLPIAVVGFPLGAASSAAKAHETREAVLNGAQEIDMVINLGALKSKDYKMVFDDILSVVLASNNRPVKVILETCQLTDEEKIIACALSKAAGAAFVKTSTGFSKSGATSADITLMRRIVGPKMGVKASGGIKSRLDAVNMIKAGANRIGTSSGIAIVKGNAADTSNY
ncbi:MAG: deoxyribose-phosphate aldolase [Bdellovibrionales bacterium RIFOXYB1_FULL_37_110]|nr:MAG: deoxyribose-phosphate aldolase [Bdellovibrionales bacterium RIFOXYA1_FULL_38_20]OFZ50061.1 MAG: deoxyribose-phosphate aldolase [Bdellovibrionales bacterium RIFOXYC1_FULL_37_79]OFZ59967.1 MAG: deoxyribose-phosphate aldolase [Bdellovibrionales bacterium RIFOXYB1_FULL_37_110]OFZ63938.1 MAG: deoxyribose-phosphate aldolase [Bdellovibrionales bacterium RIFOXYD1_FULL_36_51]